MDNSATQKFCYACGKSFPSTFQTGFRDVCPSCQAYLHCCKNCRLYDRNAYHQCKSSTTEFVQDKEKANFCAEFDWAATGSPHPLKGEGEGKKKWEDLFGG